MRTFRRYGRWLNVLCVELVLFSGCAGHSNQAQQYQQLNESDQPAESQRANSSQQKESKQTDLFWSSLKTDAKNWPERIITESNDVFLRTDNLTALLLAGGASIAMHNSDADRNLERNFSRHRVFHGFIDESINILGSPPTHFAATGLWYALSADAGDEFNKERSWTMMTALAMTGLTTVILKGIRNNRTPNGKRWAWPSGHTASSFTVASVLDEFYGPQIGVPAYIGAGLVGYRMMDTGDHWASDVVFGATLGWIVGHTIAGRHKKLELAGFEVIPYAGSSTMGVSLVKAF